LDYKFEKNIGEGAFSTVFKCVEIDKRGKAVLVNVNPDNQEPLYKRSCVAIKEIPLKDMTKQQLVNVEREINILSQLSHPDIVHMEKV